MGSVTGNGDREKLLRSKSDLVESFDRSYGSTYVGNLSEESQRDAQGLITKATHGIIDLFRFATCFDRFLIILGSIFSIAHGAGWPLLSIIFGGMTNTFLGVQTLGFTNRQQTQNTSQPSRNLNVAKNSNFSVPISIFLPDVQATKLSAGADMFEQITKDDFNYLVVQYCLYYSYVGVAMFFASYGQTLGTIAKDEQRKYAIAGGVAEEVLSCIRTVAAFNGQPRENQRYQNGLNVGRLTGIKKYINAGVGMLITFVTMYGSYALAFWYGSKLITEDETFKRGSVFTVFFAVMAGSFSLGNAVPHFNAVSQGKGAASGVLDILDNEPEIDPYSNDGRQLTEVKGEIVFQRVIFAYPTRKDITVLNDVSFTVQPGQKIAFVGASGCGKSTIVNLLLRYYDPKCGRICIDGHDLRDLNVHFLRNIIGVVSQEPILFDGTLEENIRLGNPNIGLDRIVEATKLANAYNFIQQLPLVQQLAQIRTRAT